MAGADRNDRATGPGEIRGAAGPSKGVARAESREGTKRKMTRTPTESQFRL